LSEHFADDAQAAIAAGFDEMRRFRHTYLGTERILFGLISHDQSLAATSLRHLGLTKQAVHSAIKEIIGHGDTPTGACECIAPRVKRSFERARREARNAKHSYARAEHLLLAIATSDGVATRILECHGIDETALREELAQLLPDAPEIAAALRQGPRRRQRLRRGSRGSRS
jgi:ATP-dependent Clp protease ATP-binding subunit ClpC